jgi:hypothetical protein
MNEEDARNRASEAYHAYPPEYDAPMVCDVCWRDVELCDCPECERCYAVGDLNCYAEHGLAPAADSVQAFCDHIGIEPVADVLRAIDKHNIEHVWLVFHDGTRLYYHDREKLLKVPPCRRIAKVGAGGIAWDGSDWEWADEVDVTDGDWTRLGALRSDFHDALSEYEALRDTESKEN